jgi:hypothetical protein
LGAAAMTDSGDHQSAPEELHANVQVRRFDTGATRDLDTTKLDYEGFLSPLVVKRYAEYMHANRQLADGTFRDSDNWQKGIPLSAYVKSAWRHFFDWWSEHRGIRTREGIELALCGLLFNIMGYLHEYLKAKASVVATVPTIKPGSADALIQSLLPPGTAPGED